MALKVERTRCIWMAKCKKEIPAESVRAEISCNVGKQKNLLLKILKKDSEMLRVTSADKRFVNIQSGVDNRFDFNRRHLIEILN